jgi:hypothetical protein
LSISHDIEAEVAIAHVRDRSAAPGVGPSVNSSRFLRDQLATPRSPLRGSADNDPA